LDWIKVLLRENFVHLISEPRTGSTAVYNSINYNLNEQGFNHLNLNEPLSKLKYKTLTNEVQVLCTYIKNNPKKVKVMKNHAVNIAKLDKENQSLIFSLPGKKVALSRKNLFEQACSRAIAEETGVWGQKQPKTKMNIHVNDFLDRIDECIEDKKILNQFRKVFDYKIYYEDIVFDSTYSKKNFPKSNIIKNLDELKLFFNNWIEKNYNKIQHLVPWQKKLEISSHK